MKKITLRVFILVRSYNQELRPVPSSEGFSLSPRDNTTGILLRPPQAYKYSSPLQESYRRTVFFQKPQQALQVFFLLFRILAQYSLKSLSRLYHQ